MALPANVTSFQRIIGPDAISSLGPFSLKALDGFPYTDWSNMQERYALLEKWYSGDALDDKIENETTSEIIDKYPIHINPLPNTCEKHTIILLGNNLESIRNANLPIRFTVKPKQKKSARSTDIPGNVMMDVPKKDDAPPKMKRAPRDPNIRTIVDALNNAFEDHGSGSMFVSNGILSQYLGGCVFGVSWRRSSVGNKVQVFAPLPTEFIGIPSGTNPWRLREAWYVKKISVDDAKAYGITINPLEVHYWYIEHWTEEKFRISVNDQTISVTDGETDVSVKLEGNNPFKLVPFVYIPHIRVRNFYGESIINKTIQGLIKEMNLRWADTGDAVSDDSHSTLAVRNVRDSITSITLPDGKKAVNLGGSPGLGPNEKDPDLLAVSSKSASEAMLNFGEKLENLYRKEAKHPAVADGEDEGSQRSSLTLTVRMWPLVAHVDLERINWTTGLITLAKIILTVCSVKSVYGITQEFLENYKVNIRWALTLPRDRDQLVNEVSIRKEKNLGSHTHLLSLFDDIDDVDEEMAEIRLEIEEEAARQQAQDIEKMKVVAENTPTDTKTRGGKPPAPKNYVKQD